MTTNSVSKEQIEAMMDPKWVQTLAGRIVVDVCEIERDSPEDDPMACIVYAPELDAIVERRVTEALELLSLRTSSGGVTSGEVVKQCLALVDEVTVGENPDEALEQLRAALSSLHAQPEGDAVAPDNPTTGWLIYKAGRGWYRPEAQGYTSDPKQAGRYTHEEALSYSHPNGWDGPRDGITICHESETPVVLSNPQGTGSREVVAWMHPTANWAHVKFSEVDIHCPIGSASPIPLVPLAQLQAVERENATLRQIVSDCAAALPNGAFIAPSASLEFMAKLPGEITSVCARADLAGSNGNG